MLEEHEWDLVVKAREKGMVFVHEERRKRGQAKYEPLQLSSIAERERPFLEMARLLTGFDETNPNAVWHHVAGLYGPDCPACGKPLRTKVARYCAACGFGKEDFTSEDTKPLVQRRPELFK